MLNVDKCIELKTINNTYLEAILQSISCDFVETLAISALYRFMINVKTGNLKLTMNQNNKFFYFDWTTGIIYKLKQPHSPFKNNSNIAFEIQSRDTTAAR